mmetsp:Transcript_85791/g.216063  ORF Transcript_85791/g.216063 Transcript_85791/m.216063 type:complete len:353 (-) Transcript_85791:207-1265(-)
MLPHVVLAKGRSILDVLLHRLPEVPDHFQTGLFQVPALHGLLLQGSLQRFDVLQRAVDDLPEFGDVVLQGPVLGQPGFQLLLDGGDLARHLNKWRELGLQVGLQLLLDLPQALIHAVEHALPQAPLLGDAGLSVAGDLVHLRAHASGIHSQLLDLLLHDAQLPGKGARLLAHQLPLERQKLTLLLIVELHLPIPLGLPPMKMTDGSGVLVGGVVGGRLCGAHPGAPRESARVYCESSDTATEEAVSRVVFSRGGGSDVVALDEPLEAIVRLCVWRRKEKWNFGGRSRPFRKCGRGRSSRGAVRSRNSPATFLRRVVRPIQIAHAARAVSPCSHPLRPRRGRLGLLLACQLRH